MAEEYVQDFDGIKVNEKTILERKVMEGKELSVDDRLIIIRALEKSGDSIFNYNQGLTVNNGHTGWWDDNRITYKQPALKMSPEITCDTNTTVFSTNKKIED